MKFEDALELIRGALYEITHSPSGYGRISIIVSGREIRHVNVEKPPSVRIREEKETDGKQ